MMTPPMIAALAAGAVLLCAGLAVWSKRRKKRRQFQEISQLQRRNEALNEALRSSGQKAAPAGPEGPMEISWDDKAVRKNGASAASLMLELVELSAYSRRKYVFRAEAPVLIGSGENNQIVLPREGVAVQHCEICMNGGKPCVRSAAGARTILKRGKTTVLVSPEGVYLNSGDHIQLGTAEIQFRTFRG